MRLELVGTKDLSLRERSRMPSFCSLSRFSLILSSLDCSYWDTFWVWELWGWPFWISLLGFAGDSIATPLFLIVSSMSSICIFLCVCDWFESLTVEYKGLRLWVLKYGESRRESKVGDGIYPKKKKKKIGDGTNKLKIFYCKQYAFRGIVKKIIPISNLKRWVYWFINSTININSYINFIIN